MSEPVEETEETDVPEATSALAPTLGAAEGRVVVALGVVPRVEGSMAAAGAVDDGGGLTVTRSGAVVDDTGTGAAIVPCVSSIGSGGGGGGGRSSSWQQHEARAQE